MIFKFAGFQEYVIRAKWLSTIYSDFASWCCVKCASLMLAHRFFFVWIWIYMLLFKDKLNETRNRKCILGTHARTHLIGNVVMVIAAQAIKATRHQTRGNNNGGSSGNDGVATLQTSLFTIHLPRSDFLRFIAISIVKCNLNSHKQTHTSENNKKIHK